MIPTLVLAAALTVAVVVHTLWSIRRTEPGERRDLQKNSLWSIGGSAGILVSIALGVSDDGPHIPLRVGVLVVSAASLAIGGVQLRRLRARHREAALLAERGASTVPERLEAVEARHALARRTPRAIAVVLLAAPVLVAWTMLRVTLMSPSPTAKLVFGAAGLGAVALFGVMSVRLLRERAAHSAHEAEVAAILGPGPGPG